MPRQLAGASNRSIQLPSLLLTLLLVPLLTPSNFNLVPSILLVLELLVVRHLPAVPARAGEELRRCADSLVYDRRRRTREAGELVDRGGQDEEDVRERRVRRTADRVHLQLRRRGVRHLLREDGVFAADCELFRVYDEEWVRKGRLPRC